MKYISALDMPFNIKAQKCKSAKVFNKIIIYLYFVSCCYTVILLSCSKSSAEVIDRVVAYVDNSAITLSDLQQNYSDMKKNIRDITEKDVLNSLINYTLLLREAKKMRIESPNDDEMIKDYIDIKIRSLIFIKEDEIKKFYSDHISEFKGRDYLAVRDEIEKYLFELETNRQLKNHIEGLRENAEIRIQIEYKQ